MLARFPVTLGFGFKDGLPVAGVMLLIAWALMRLRSKQRTNRSLATPQEIIERNRQARGMKGQLEELMVEVEALTRRFGVQLDAKARRLENLLSQADERIAQLRELQGQPPLDHGQQMLNNDHHHAPKDEQLQQNAVPRPAQPVQEDPLALSVYQLADQGIDAQSIALQLNEHVGKVELILALRKSR